VAGITGRSCRAVYEQAVGSTRWAAKQQTWRRCYLKLSAWRLTRTARCAARPLRTSRHRIMVPSLALRRLFTAIFGRTSSGVLMQEPRLCARAENGAHGVLTALRGARAATTFNARYKTDVPLPALCCAPRFLAHLACALAPRCAYAQHALLRLRLGKTYYSLVSAWNWAWLDDVNASPLSPSPHLPLYSTLSDASS